MPTTDTLHTLLPIVTSLAMLIAVWWKVSKDNALNRKSIEAHEKDILLLRDNKTENSVTSKLIAAIDKIESELIEHHTDFRLHRTDDSERRMTDLFSSVNELARENRADHQSIMVKLGQVERMTAPK